MEHFDRAQLQMKLMTMTDSELLAREVSLSSRRPCPTPEAIEYGLLMSELQRRTQSEEEEAEKKSNELPEPTEGEVEAALAAAVAYFLRAAGKDEIVLNDRQLTGEWLEVSRTPDAWAFRVKDSKRP